MLETMKKMETTLPLQQKKRATIKSISSTTYNQLKCIVGGQLEGKIRWLCEKLPTKEWSGVLLYECKETKDSLEILAKDVFLMDIGSGSYTEFKTNFDVFQYQVNNGLLDCYTGLIHSHNSMPAFFSGQDIYTLEDNAPDMNRFFSLIVNNVGEYKAAITRKNGTIMEKVNRTTTYKSFEDKEFTVEDSIDRMGEPEYIAEYVSIVKEDPIFNKEAIAFLSTQFDEIQERKRVEAEERAKKHTPYQLSIGWDKNLDIDWDWKNRQVQENKNKQGIVQKTLYDGDFDKFVEHMGNILVTGILTLPVNSALDIKHWVKHKMARHFTARFGNSKSRLFEGYLETMMYSIETNFEAFCEEEPAQQSIVFDDYDYVEDYDCFVFTYTELYKYISNLGDNDWINAILDNLIDTGYVVPLLEQELDKENMEDGRTTE